MIGRIAHSLAHKARLEKTLGNVSRYFWRSVSKAGYEVGIVGDPYAVRRLIDFAEDSQLEKIKCVITVEYGPRLTDKSRRKDITGLNDVDLIVVPEQHMKHEIAAWLRTEVCSKTPVHLLFDEFMSIRSVPSIAQKQSRKLMPSMPEQSYVIASTRRTGSTMLCSLMKATRMMGYPKEYIEEKFSILAGYKIIDAAAILDDIVINNQTENGIFGINAHWSSFELFHEAVMPVLDSEHQRKINRFFDESHYIYLTRKDKISQAISDWRAHKSGVYRISSNTSRALIDRHHSEIPYEYALIKHKLKGILRDEECWSKFFKSQDITPFEIVHEDMTSQPRETIRQISENLGLEAGNREVNPRSKKMADAYSQIIYDRFVSDLTSEFGVDISSDILGLKDTPVSWAPNALQRGLVRNRHVFVTLATADYLDHSKQLFASAYYNAGWDGDYLLLAHEVADEELDWFRNRGIIVRHCSSMYEGLPGGMHACLSSKFYMFTPFFKQWDTVIYSDVDAIVRAPLDELKDVKGFNAVEDWSPSLSEQIVNEADIKQRGHNSELCNKIIGNLAQDYKISKRPFCAGFFAFSTDIISENTFEELKGTMNHYHVVSKYGDQLTMNLYFYKQWNRLHPTYNLLIRQDPGKPPFFNPFRATTRWGLFKNMDGYVLHIFNPKPWEPGSTFYFEWLANLKRAEKLNVSRVPVVDQARLNGIIRTRRRIIPRQFLFEIAEYFGIHKMKVIRFLESIYWKLQLFNHVPALASFVVRAAKGRVFRVTLRVNTLARGVWNSIWT